MKKEDIINNHSLLKRFVKDYKLPIQVVQQPFFEYFIDLYDELHQTKQKFKIFEDYLTTLEHQENFFSMNDKIISRFKEKFSQLEVFKNFNNLDLQQEYKIQKKIPQKDMYNIDNIGVEFISIDLRQANFNVFKLLDPSSELTTYFDFLKKTIDELSFNQKQKECAYEYFKNSKMIRQVIFGELNPSRQQALQRYVISQLCEKLNSHHLDITSASSDEIIVKNFSDIQKIKEILKDVSESFKFFRVEKFKLESIMNGKPFFLKISTEKEQVDILSMKVDDMFVQKNHDVKFEIKNYSQFLYPQIYKHLKREEVNELDKTFYYEGFLSVLKDDLFPKPNFNKKMKIN